MRHKRGVAYLVKTSLTAALAAVLCVASGTARAGWQGATWNSSPEQANKEFRLPHRAPDTWWQFERIAFDYALGDLEFDGALLFKHNRLTWVDLYLKDPSKCEKLIEILRRIYGRPAKDEPDDYMWGEPATIHHSSHELIWYDQENSNEVYLNQQLYHDHRIEDDCHLHYMPFIIPKPGQL